MNEKIRSRITKRGHKNESSWPSDFGTLDKTPMYVCRKTGRVKKGYPKPPKIDQKAPTIIFDEMPAQYHEAAKRRIDRRSEWRLADKQHGTITMGPNENWTPRDPTIDDKIERREDIREARKRAVADVLANRAPLTEDQKALCRKADERISQQLGYDVRKIWKPKKRK